MKRTKFEQKNPRDDTANRDQTRDKYSVKETRRKARRAQNTRRAFEHGKGWKV